MSLFDLSPGTVIPADDKSDLLDMITVIAPKETYWLEGLQRQRSAKEHPIERIKPAPDESGSLYPERWYHRHSYV